MKHLFLAILLLFPVAVYGQHSHAPAKEMAPVTLETGLGDINHPVSTSNPEAQKFFNQGLSYIYAFNHEEAIRSFKQAAQLDPQLAMAYWGVALALGSNYNVPADGPALLEAYNNLQKAIQLAPKASEQDRAYITALSKRYSSDINVDKHKLEVDYKNAMGELSKNYPDDLDAATLYADALFLLEPRRGTRDVNEPTVQRLHATLEKILAVDVHHPGACHLYIHATESTVVPGKAEECAEFLMKSIPGASHINHMPSHTWNEIGRWADSVRANIEAWHSDQKAAIGEGFAIYPEHNLHMLLYAASMDGQGAIAIQAGRDYAKLNGNTMYHALTLVRFGRFDEIAAITARPKGDIPGGFWDFAQGYAHLRAGETDFAKVYAARVLAAADSSKEMFRVNPAKNLLGTVGGILDGEIKRAAKDLPGAIAAFERAVQLEDELPYDEPEPLPFAARHWLGAALLEAGRLADAERVYREELEDHPHNGWSLLGLKQALTGRGMAADEVDADLTASWARSEVWTRSSRF